MANKRKWGRRLLWVAVAAFAGMNVVAFFHAWKFTHFAEAGTAKTKSPENLGGWSKLQALAMGVSNPRPTNDKRPKQQYETIALQSNKKVECWYIKTDDTVSANGTVAIFHGYSGNKASMLDKADEFLQMGYNVLLADFMGSGGSEGNQTTLGYCEAEQVKTVYDYLAAGRGERNIYLFGTSMGAAAILKAMAVSNISPRGLILECPFGSMYTTTCARFRIMGVPTFPMAPLLVLWGGVQNGFWAFRHNPARYAKSVHCPTLLLYGLQDRNVSRAETDEIYSNLAGPKTLRTYPNAGHENYLLKYRDAWVEDVQDFLSAN